MYSMNQIRFHGASLWFDLGGWSDARRQGMLVFISHDPSFGLRSFLFFWVVYMCFYLLCLSPSIYRDLSTWMTNRLMIGMWVHQYCISGAVKIGRLNTGLSLQSTATRPALWRTVDWMEVTVRCLYRILHSNVTMLINPLLNMANICI